MKNRTILARIGAKRVKKPAPVKKEKPQKITAISADDASVVAEFASFEEAEAAGFRPVNIKSSLKTGNKYKGLLWSLSK